VTARTVSLVGSTGSIGTQAVDVITAEPDRYRVVALGASTSIDLLAEQAHRLHPDVVAVADADLAPKLEELVPPGTDVLGGAEALPAISRDADVVLNAVVGFAGLPVTMAALEAGRRLALANKESLIAGGPVVQQARATPGAEIVPVDSEHCAIHQCLRTGERREVRRIVITASGGPFRGRKAEDLAGVTVAEALAHPTWNMGPKITIDSSTLMNKGLEVIEAHELFGLDFDAFPCLGLAYQAGRMGGTAPACLNAANEVAVAAFLEGVITWTAIADVIREVLEELGGTTANTVDVVIDADRRARERARRAVQQRAR